MEIFPMLFVISAFLFSILSTSTTGIQDITTISLRVSIKDGGSTLVSAGGSFELGFFSPGSSKSRYVGIWYKDISPQKLVWVCNKETPLTDHSGALNLTSQGVLVLFTGKHSIVWSSSNKTSSTSNPVAQLLDSGNFVVKDGSNEDSKILWQSFDYPSDTLLPGMKIGWDLKSGLNRFLSSWKGAEDPAPGQFSFSIDRSGYPQLVLMNGSIPHFRLGSWNGLGFTGSPQLRSQNQFFKLDFVSNENEVYYKYELLSTSVESRLVLNRSGDLQRFMWSGTTNINRVIYSAPVDHCDAYNFCGAFALCSIDSPHLCACLQGFAPNSLQKSCHRKTPLSCNEYKDGFKKFTRVKLPDTTLSWFDLTMTLGECEQTCLKNCSCTAYANSDAREGGTGCLLWFGELNDIHEFDTGGQDLFVKLGDIKTNKRSSMKKQVAIIVSFGLFVMGVLILGLVFYIRKKKSRVNKKYIHGNIEGGNDDMELLKFDLCTISRATDDFSDNYKLGEGGFGPVYKGTLKEGEDMAVKRLSKCSGQGIKEFMNEVMLIAKLQHRNLVKLLGCCVEGDEKMLIYEYMPNRSLDYFIFEDTRKKVLGWAQRSNIIGGIARGLLYLHQDSRLRIIHRDLKTGNVLLDKDMNPKISDFGTARAFGGDQTEENTKTVVGTYGYMSPEYMVDGLFSIKSDVYSFGVMVLEIVSGKKNRGYIHPDHQLNLLGHAWTLWTEGRPLEVIDKQLGQSCALSEVSRCIHIALLCMQQQPEDRPHMATVVLMLGGEGSLPVPKQPGFFTERNPFEAENSSSSKLESHSINDMSITELEAR
uniref:G-type lectin S-receptor-like serine/threonine-protein kinase At4g27290 isoform X1 n=1 Tax=Fragaria vesca subsp. vesca TaxID=101020 RepID=UPI0005C997D5|nr:PREDICTED: G-type lectin S-receptor-like serine/threonine-protein kinase At4g27290 isoform X1 [Fragaria vesca subsp. vesca]